MKSILNNFRDISKYCQNLKSNYIYRSSSLSTITSEDISEFLEKYSIKTIIDLRSQDERNDDSYLSKIKSNINIIHAPFDPCNQSKQFQDTWGRIGSNEEIAYRLFGTVNIFV